MLSVKTCLFTILLILTLSPMLHAQDNTAAQMVEYLVTADSANLRSGAGTNFEIVSSVQRGDTLLVYSETPEVAGWLRVHDPGGEDAYIADFLVERAPQRFYPPEQEPILTASGRGSNITDVYDIPKGAYRVDATVEDNAFILEYIAVEGDCRDSNIFNEVNFDVNRLILSGLFVSSGCSIIFQTDNVDGNWEFELRDLIDPDYFPDNLLTIETGTSLAGTGRALTMGTKLGIGVWTISGTVNDQAFILHSHILVGECEDTSIFNELDFNSDTLEISTVYRNPGETDCVIYWETDNVEGSWEVIFEKLR